MIEACQDILAFVQDFQLEEFGDDKKTRAAVERQLLIIGEAAAHVSEAFKGRHPDIPWKRIIGLRNILAHEYGEVLVERIWQVVKENIPCLMESLKKEIPDTGP